MRHVLLAGVSTRAAAESAARAGLQVTAVDGFGDLDQHPSVRALPLPGRFTIGKAVRMARAIPCDAVAYLSSFENYPGAVRRLAADRTLWGNTPSVLQDVRNPIRVAAAFRRRGVAAPDVRTDAARPGSLRGESGRRRSHARRWLVKPVASGGGRGVRMWRGTRLPRGSYLQELVDGAPGSVVFVAANGRAVPVGISRQLIGEDAFGSEGYRYCGSIMMAAGDPHVMFDEHLADGAFALVRAATEEFGLVGVNGIDFVARGREPFAIEINPRWCASMELAERAYGLCVFAAHAEACSAGELPRFDLVRARRRQQAFGKAVVFARRDVVAGDTREWLGDDSVRDVPRPGERIAAGRPICTVLAAAADSAACHAALMERAARVYADVSAWTREASHPVRAATL